MATELRSDEAPLSLLEIHFGVRADVAQRIIDVLASDPGRSWRAAELLDVAGVDRPSEGYMLLARLAYLGMIAHPGLGAYASAEPAANVRIA